MLILNILNSHIPVKLPSGTQSIERTFELLKALGARPGIGWRLTDLAAHCGLNTSTTHRIMNCLLVMRLARQRARDKRYVPGPGLFEYALSLPAYFEFQDACREHLLRLAKSTGWVAFLSLRSEEETVCLDRVGTSSVNLLNKVGRRLPLAGSAMGVAILMALPKAEQRVLLRANRKALRSNPAHKDRAYDRMWERSQQFGTGLNLGDIVPGAASTGSVIRNAHGLPLAAIGLSGPVSEFTTARLAQVKSMMEAEVKSIEQQLASLIAELEL